MCGFMCGEGVPKGMVASALLRKRSSHSWSTKKKLFTCFTLRPASIERYPRIRIKLPTPWDLWSYMCRDTPFSTNSSIAVASSSSPSSSAARVWCAWSASAALAPMWRFTCELRVSLGLRAVGMPAWPVRPLLGAW
jgi:hypothetical protein